MYSSLKVENLKNTICLAMPQQLAARIGAKVLSKRCRKLTVVMKKIEGHE